MRVRAALVALLIGVFVLPAASIGTGEPAGSALPAAAALTGAVWTGANEPVPDALVRLRNVTTTRIEQLARANELGRFEFRNLESGQYLVEVVDASGRVLAVGSPLSVAPGEIVATFVRLAMRKPWFSGFFGNAAAAVVSTAANLGVTAVRPADQAISPERPG